MNGYIRVVDCVYGLPAVGVPVDVIREFEGTVVQQWRNHTGDDGYVSGLTEAMQGRGSYTLIFDLDGYFRKLGYTTLNSAISVRFNFPRDSHHCGLSILITPSSCVTFREDWLPEDCTAGCDGRNPGYRNTSQHRTAAALLAGQPEVRSS